MGGMISEQKDKWNKTVMDKMSSLETKLNEKPTKVGEVRQASAYQPDMSNDLIAAYENQRADEEAREGTRFFDAPAQRENRLAPINPYDNARSESTKTFDNLNQTIEYFDGKRDLPFHHKSGNEGKNFYAEYEADQKRKNSLISPSGIGR